ncbi:hypothetical protein B0H14DRAFT_2575650 [Mycena olivaceomarginata]|nr:hypothetical protein B0H14DRAFT_2575650 [Mycena olivaceomarginata]
MAPTPNTTGDSASGSAPECTLEERTLANEQAMVNINAQLTLILAAMKPDGAPAPIVPMSAPEPQNTLPPLVMPQSQPRFTPPIAPINSPAVITHDLVALDLYKLDKRVKDPTPQLLVDMSESGNRWDGLHKAQGLQNPKFGHLSPPCLFRHPWRAPESLALEYEWSAVFEYHTLFFDLRQEDMLGGLYDNWGSPDANLLCVHVYPFKKRPRL